MDRLETYRRIAAAIPGGATTASSAAAVAGAGGWGGVGVPSGPGATWGMPAPPPPLAATAAPPAYDPDAYRLFRSSDLLEAAVGLAEAGQVEGLTVLLQRHPAGLPPLLAVQVRPNAVGCCSHKQRPTVHNSIAAAVHTRVLVLGSRA